MLRYALLLAADRYQDRSIQPLKFAERDARLLDGFLRESARFDRVEELFGDRLERSAAVDLAEELAGELSAKGGGVLLLFYAGHGFTHLGKHCLLCPKARLRDLDEYDHALTVDRLRRVTDAPGVERQFVMDACRTVLRGGDRDGVGGYRAEGLRDLAGLPRSAAAVGGFSVLASCDEGEQATELESLKQGVFAVAWLDELRCAHREGFELRVDDALVARLRERVAMLARENGLDRIQRPWRHGNSDPVVLIPGRVASAGTSAQVPTQESKPSPGPWLNSLGMRFVRVAVDTAGSSRRLFSVWATRVQDYEIYARERSGTENSWRNPTYDGVAVTPSGECPVVNVSWTDANGFCDWLTERERALGLLPSEARYRLPSDAEWSWAAGIGETEELSALSAPALRHGCICAGSHPNAFPWGGTWPPGRGAGNYADATAEQAGLVTYGVIEGYTDGFPTTSPVGHFPPNAVGLFDLGSNVREWCLDLLEGGSAQRVQRGASWDLSSPADLLTSRRGSALPHERFLTCGFRVVVEGI